MSAEQFIQVLSQIPFVLIFIAVLQLALRRPRRANVDIALLFGAYALAVGLGWVEAALDAEDAFAIRIASVACIMALPYLLLRIVDDFAVVPAWLLRANEGALVLFVVAFAVTHPERPPLLTLLAIVYFVGVNIYNAVAFVQAARRGSGVTRRRMQAAAVGSFCIGLLILYAGIVLAVPALEGLPALIPSDILAITIGVSYFVAFAPPRWLRRSWQEPELRALLARVAILPRLPDTAAIVRELERGAAASLGAPSAIIGLFDEDARALRYSGADQVAPVDDQSWIANRAFSRQSPVFVPDAARADPLHASMYREAGATAILAAPITAGSRHLGVLAIYAPRAPIFAEDDLELVQLLADQAAVILESRALIDEATRVRAAEEATRLKDDFLVAAAHDLRTPLTALITQAQLLERRALRDPHAPADLAGIQRLGSQLQRLHGLITELLDAARVEHGQLLAQREPADLTEIARQVTALHHHERHQVIVDAPQPVVSHVDRSRFAQLVENLVENAVKYSPHGGEVRVNVWREQDEARLRVQDHGIGIPAADLPHVFDRFHRAANADGRQYAGLGLGLYICRGIVEQHGGRIWVTSAAGTGSTFDIALPLHAPITDGAAPQADPLPAAQQPVG